MEPRGKRGGSTVGMNSVRFCLLLGCFAALAIGSACSGTEEAAEVADAGDAATDASPLTDSSPVDDASPVDGETSTDAATDATEEYPDAALDSSASVESVGVVNVCTLLPSPDAGAVNFAQDVLYATLGGQPQYLDVAWPKSGASHPLVVAIHGGGWNSGDKSALRTTILALANAGYTAASVNYRLLDKTCPPDGGTCNVSCDGGVGPCYANTFPAQIEDVRCSVRWLRANAATYTIDPARVAALGTSAGGHLAALIGNASDVSALDGDGLCPSLAQDVHVLAAVSYFPITDVTNFPPSSSLGKGMPHFLGVATVPGSPQAALASPISHIDPKDPPVLLIHGTADTTVPISHSRNYLAGLHDAGVPATLVEVPDAGHGFSVFSGSPATLLPPSCTTVAFLEKFLKP